MARSRRARLPRHDLPNTTTWHGIRDLPSRGDDKTLWKKEMAKGRGLPKKCGGKRAWGFGGLKGWIDDAVNEPPAGRRRLPVKMPKLVSDRTYRKEKVTMLNAGFKVRVVGDGGRELRVLQEKFHVRINVKKQRYRRYVTISGKPYGILQATAAVRHLLTPSAAFSIPGNNYGTIIGQRGVRKTLLEKKFDVKVCVAAGRGYIFGNRSNAQAAASAISKIARPHQPSPTKTVLCHAYKTVQPPPAVAPHSDIQVKATPHVTGIKLTPNEDFTGTFTVVFTTVHSPHPVVSREKLTAPKNTPLHLPMAATSYPTVRSLSLSMPPYTTKAPKTIKAEFYSGDQLLGTTVGVTSMQGCVYDCTINGPWADEGKPLEESTSASSE